MHNMFSNQSFQQNWYSLETSEQAIIRRLASFSNCYALSGQETIQTSASFHRQMTTRTYSFFFPSLFSNYSFKKKSANNYIRTRSYGRGPCQPIVEAAVAIVQPKFVLGARQAVLELYHVAYVDGGYGGVGWWITDSRAVVQTVPRTSLAQVSWYLDREVCRIRDLKTWRDNFQYTIYFSL